ncbi:Zinc finger, CCCH-type [Niveomyces insectorum RCEF 264]|uniref:Zinc finger, CCCH-type n=1 Tax=Niveomyces insectorum RCEF 264 TaxID=1081102 RepID=A0A168A1C4_9HYPO|nr:Zinc finger, CCCH-type [Niveomyces insectorum RCEF 264]
MENFGMATENENRHHPHQGHCFCDGPQQQQHADRWPRQSVTGDGRVARDTLDGGTGFTPGAAPHDLQLHSHQHPHRTNIYSEPSIRLQHTSHVPLPNCHHPFSTLDFSHNSWHGHAGYALQRSSPPEEQPKRQEHVQVQRQDNKADLRWSCFRPCSSADINSQATITKNRDSGGDFPVAGHNNVSYPLLSLPPQSASYQRYGPRSTRANDMNPATATYTPFPHAPEKPEEGDSRGIYHEDTEHEFSERRPPVAGENTSTQPDGQLQHGIQALSPTRAGPNVDGVGASGSSSSGGGGNTANTDEQAYATGASSGGRFGHGGYSNQLSPLSSPFDGSQVSSTADHGSSRQDVFPSASDRNTRTSEPPLASSGYGNVTASTAAPSAASFSAPPVTLPSLSSLTLPMPASNERAPIYAYCFDRGNGLFTRLIPADLLPPLKEIPRVETSCHGMIVLRDPLDPQPVPEPSRTALSPVRAVAPALPFGVAGSTGTTTAIASRLQPQQHPSSRHSVLPPPVAPMMQRFSKKNKIYCDKWVHEGICAFTQQGCKFKHEMPHDRNTQKSLGLFHGYPTWYKKFQNEQTAGALSTTEPVSAASMPATPAAPLGSATPTAVAQRHLRMASGTGYGRRDGGREMGESFGNNNATSSDRNQARMGLVWRFDAADAASWRSPPPPPPPPSAGIPKTGSNNNNISSSSISSRKRNRHLEANADDAVFGPSTRGEVPQQPSSSAAIAPLARDSYFSHPLVEIGPRSEGSMGRDYGPIAPPTTTASAPFTLPHRSSSETQSASGGARYQQAEDSDAFRSAHANKGSSNSGNQ